jgi:hypothetical protein
MGIAGGDATLHVHGAGSVLYVHGLILRGAFFTELGSGEPTGFYAQRRAAHIKDRDQPRLPRLLHPGEVIPFEWPHGLVDESKPFFLYCAVPYSIEGPDGEVREVTVEGEVTRPRPPGG